MKFGKQIKRLADPAQLNHCIAYDILKKAINVVCASEKGANDALFRADCNAVTEAFGPSGIERKSFRPLDSRFHELLQHELAKVNRFVALELRTLTDSLRMAHRGLLKAEKQPSEADLDAIENILEQVSDGLVKLESFRRLNFTGFRKIAKKFDKQSSLVRSDSAGTLFSWFVPQLLREYFISAPLDALILVLAWAYSGLRRIRRGLAPPAPQSNPASSPAAPNNTSTSIFMLMPSARMRALCALVRRFDIMLPTSAYMASGPLATSSLERQQRLVLSMTPEKLAMMPSITVETSLAYYDTPDFSLYQRRLSRESTGPVGFRCRHTRARGCNLPDFELVERDGVASAIGFNAFTDIMAEGPYAASESFQFLGGSSAVPSLGSTAADVATSAEKEGRPDLAAFAREVQQMASEANLQLMATVGSARILLKGDTSATQGISIALDEDVQFSLNSVGLALAAPSDTLDFPYCLLEVASDSGDGFGPWLDEVRSMAALRTIDGFSTAVHATAALHRKAVLELPHWFKHLEDLRASAPPEAWGLTLEWRAAMGENEEFVRSRLDSVEGGPVLVDSDDEKPKRKKSEKPEKPDIPKDTSKPKDKGPQAAPAQNVPALHILPKNFLATERTMLEWMHTVTALGFMGVTLWKLSLPKASDDRLGGLFNKTDLPDFLLGVFGLSLVVIALIFVWHAALSHIKRTGQFLEGKQTEYVFNSARAPTMLSLAIATSMVVHLVVQTVAVFADSSEKEAL